MMASQVDAIAANIMQIEHNIASMKTEGKALLVRLETLRSSMQVQYAQLDHLHSLCPRIIVLPNEILIEIFKAYLSVSKVDEDTAFVQQKTTLCLSHVCRYWRQISIDTRQLWSPIYIGLENNSPGQFSMLQLFLERSGTGPLDISIIVKLSTPYPDDWVKFADQLKLILPAISRWRRIYVFGEMRHGIYKALRAFTSLHVPYLEMLDVLGVPCCIEDEDDEDDGDDDSYLLHIFQGGAPLLKHLRVRGTSLTTCKPPLSALVSLDLDSGWQDDCLTFEQYREALTTSTALTDLCIMGDQVSIMMMGTTGESNHEPSAIILPSLRRLTISAPDIGLSKLLRMLETPMLESLTIVSRDWLRELHTIGLPTYPMLRFLQLDGATFCCREEPCIFQHTPALAHISLNTCPQQQELLEALLPRELQLGADNQNHTTSYPAPLLHVIDISMVTAHELDTLCAVISNRISRNVPLECVRFSCDGLENIAVDKLKWLRERLRVEVYSYKTQTGYWGC
jgi:hypothetical protein